MDHQESPGKLKRIAAGWRTGLLMTGSALLGGIAVVLWNRRILTELRGSEFRGEPENNLKAMQPAGTDEEG